MLTQGKELSVIDFSSIIGGPLQAVVAAQAASATTTSSFINSIAFETRTQNGQVSPTNKLKVAEFDYSNMLKLTNSKFSGNASIRVPMLSIVPVPFLRVDSVNLQFNVNLVAMENSSDTDVSTSATSGSAEYCTIKAQGSVTDQNTHQNNAVVDDTYSMSVTVHAVQDQMPAGLQNVLGIFGNIISQQASMLQKIMNAEVEALTKQITGGGGPGLISGLTATPSTGSIALSWSATPPSGVTPAYTLTRTPSFSSPATVSGTSYTDSSTTAGTSYTYTLAATYSGGTSAPTGTDTLTAQAKAT